MTKTVKSLRALPKKGLPSESPTQPVTETPSRKLARLTQEHAAAVEELQKVKRDFHAENLAAQAAHMAVATSRLTWVEKRKGELAARILSLNTEIGEINREIRANKAERQAGRNGGSHHFAPPAPKPAVRSGRKDCPLRDRPDWAEYFMLAAKGELTEALYAQIERTAKSLLTNAIQMNITE